MDDTTSPRRLVRLGTAAAGPAAPAIATGNAASASLAADPKNVDRSAWDAALAKVEREHARDADLDARHAQAEADGTLTAALEQEWSDSVEPLCAAEWEAFDTPAPDMQALHWKVTMLGRHGLAFEDAIAATIIADVARLSCGEN